MGAWVHCTDFVGVYKGAWGEGWPGEPPEGNVEKIGRPLLVYMACPWEIDCAAIGR